ncbi:MAG: protein kinase [Elusimicrobia bacterium]|nr:protein kinase [Elusimicrobiota bacterium]
MPVHGVLLAALLSTIPSPGRAADDVTDERPPSDFILLEVDKSSARLDQEAVLSLQYPAECAFSGIDSRQYDARETDTQFIEYHPHQHQRQVQRKTLAPVSSKFSSEMSSRQGVLNQAVIPSLDFHRHQLRRTRYALKLVQAGAIAVGPFQVTCGGKAYQTAQRQIKVASGDEILYKAVSLQTPELPAPTAASGPLAAPEPRPDIGLPPAALPPPPPDSRERKKGLPIGLLAGLAGGVVAAGCLILAAFRKAPAGAPLPRPAPRAQAPLAISPPPAAPQTDPLPQAPAPAPVFSPSPRPGGKPMIGGKYEILSELGRGGMGKVLLAQDARLSRRVAVKQMRPEIRSSARDCGRFLAEARIIAKLRHPYIVGIHDIVEDADQVYLILDYIEGKTLAAILEDKGKLSLPECKQLFHYICDAVDFAHRSKILHRDLKPANIMVNKEGFAMVTDFGIAREAKDTICRVTQTEAAGSPAYMAPEQHLGEVCKASDVYALAVMIYEALTGSLPFPGPDFLAQKERGSFAPPSSTVEALNFRCDRLLADALAPDPGQRPQSAAALFQGLKEL